jgi:hypothetical protein
MASIFLFLHIFCFQVRGACLNRSVSTIVRAPEDELPCRQRRLGHPIFTGMPL